MLLQPQPRSQLQRPLVCACFFIFNPLSFELQFGSCQGMLTLIDMVSNELTFINAHALLGRNLRFGAFSESRLEITLGDA